MRKHLVNRCFSGIGAEMRRPRVRQGKKPGAGGSDRRTGATADSLTAI